MIAEKPQYQGQCMLCKQTLNKAQMTRHLKKCVAEHTEAGGKPVKMFHLVIEGNHMPVLAACRDSRSVDIGAS